MLATPAPVQNATDTPTPTITSPCPTEAVLDGALACIEVNNFRDLDISPDGNTLVIAGDEITLVRLDTYEQVWSHSMDIPVNGITFSPDSKTIISSQFNGMVAFWDAETGSRLRTLESGEIAFSVAVSPDGTILVVGGYLDITLWDTDSGNLISRRQGYRQLDVVNSISFSPDGSHFATGSDGGYIFVWELGSEVLSYTIEASSHAAYSISFSPDGAMIAAGTYEGNIILWHFGTGEIFQTIPCSDSVTSIAFSGDGRMIASGVGDGTIMLWDLATGELISTRHGHTGIVWAMEWSPDGQVLVSGSQDGRIIIWGVTP